MQATGSSCAHVQVLKLRHAQEVDKLEQLLVQCEQQRGDAIAKLESQVQYMQVRVPSCGPALVRCVPYVDSVFERWVIA